MSIDKNIIFKLEKLSLIELTDGEREHMRQDLNNILAMIEKMAEVDTDGVEPLTHMNTEAQTFRDDIINNELEKEKAISLSKATKDGFFIVPKIIK